MNHCHSTEFPYLFFCMYVYWTETQPVWVFVSSFLFCSVTVAGLIALLLNIWVWVMFWFSVCPVSLWSQNHEWSQEGRVGIWYCGLADIVNRIELRSRCMKCWLLKMKVQNINNPFLSISRRSKKENARAKIKKTCCPFCFVFVHLFLIFLIISNCSIWCKIMLSDLGKCS